jgi:hypothetical protein
MKQALIEKYYPHKDPTAGTNGQSGHQG